ncbi:MAG: CpsD/CapB family tyrosine-protein kinase [Bryobacteraceae bacterium]
MSRVHDALRKAAQERGPEAPKTPRRAEAHTPSDGNVPPVSRPVYSPPPAPAEHLESSIVAVQVDADDLENMEEAIRGAREFPYHPLNEALLVDVSNPREAPAEEFRSLRTRLNHLQTLQPLRALVVTSASPAEGKSFTAMNLAVAQAQLADKRVLLADFDFRRPFVDKAFQVDMSPGITEYLQGKARISEIIRRIAGTNLYLMTGGEAVPNPLELLNLKECRALIEALRANFDWVILDSPPLLFAADGNLLATMCDGTILVVRIGATTFDAVTRAMQSLCENNVLGVVVNGARRGELYSKYSYYHDYYSPEAQKQTGADEEEQEEEAISPSERGR